MARLKASWELKNEIKNLNISEELKAEIEKYITNNDDSSTGIDQRFSNLFYRSNLHYIIDNYSNSSLVNELKVINN